MLNELLPVQGNYDWTVMKPFCRTMHISAILSSLLGALTTYAAPIPAPPADYSYMWFNYGVRDPRLVFSIQTNHYALSFDLNNMLLTHLHPLAAPLSQDEALVQPNEALFGAPTASLACKVTVDGAELTLTGAGTRASRNNDPGKTPLDDNVIPEVEHCQLVDSGRFFQRRWIEDLKWSAESASISKKSGLEISAWPDRVSFALRVIAEAAIEKGSVELTLDLDDIYHLLSSNCEARAFLSSQGAGYVLLPVTEGTAIRTEPASGRITIRLDTTKWEAGTERAVGVAIYPVAAEGTAALAAVASEQGGVTFTAKQFAPVEADLQTTYDATHGWYRVALRNDVVGNNKDPMNFDRMERVALSLKNDTDMPRTARLLFEKDKATGVFGIVGISPMIRDSAGNPTGIPVQISKNWHNRAEAPQRFEGGWYHGFTMITVPAKSTIDLEYTSVNAHWGGAPAASHAQLSLAGWGANQLWDQAAMGSWGEQLCFEPDQTQIGGAVLDTRPLMVRGFQENSLQWGFGANVGGADFLVYYDRERNKQWNSRMRTEYCRIGPDLTEVTYAGQSYDGKIDTRATVRLYRSDDITRGIYRFRHEVREPVDFSRIVFFQCGGDDYSYTSERKFAWGNENGLVKEWDTQWGDDRYRTEPFEITGRVPWFSMHEVDYDHIKGDLPNNANRGIILREWKAQLGGEPAQPWAAERGAHVRGADTSLIDILPPPGVTQLLPGDFVECVVEHVVVAEKADEYYGPNENLKAALTQHANTWRMIDREAKGNDLAIEVTEGTLELQRPTRIRAAADRAQLRIEGGLGYVPVTFTGLSAYAKPHLEISDDGQNWSVVDQSVHGNDFWQTDFDQATKTWEITYTLPLDTPGDVRKPRWLRFALDAATP